MSIIDGQRVLPDGRVFDPSSDRRVSQDPDGYPPSQDQNLPAMAYNTGAGHALVVWQDKGHYAPETDEGIWGRLWVPVERVMLPLVVRSWE